MNRIEPTSTSLPKDPSGLRVLVISRCGSVFGRSRGGADVLSQQHAEVLARQGFDVTYVGTSAPGEAGIEHVSVRTRDFLRPAPSGASPGRVALAYLLNEGAHIVHGTLVAARLQRHRSADVVISNSSIATILLRILTSSRRIVYYVHDSLYSEEAHGRRRAEPVRYFLNHVLERVGLWSADRVICASDGIASQVAAMGYPREELSVMHPLVRRSTAEPSAPTAIRAESIQRLRPFLLSVGQQTGRKRFDLLIEALRAVPSSLRLVLVGDGPLNATYREQAREAGLSERVTFLPNVDDRTLDQLYQSCATYVLASENEGFPITVAEALTRGCPVVLACPSTTDLKTTLASKHTLILRELSGSAIARGIRTVLERVGPVDDATRQSIRRWAVHRFPSEREIGRSYDRIFDSLVSGSPLGHPSPGPP